MSWLRKIELLEPGDACEFYYPARPHQWIPGVVIRNGGSGWWSIRADGKVQDGVYIEQVRLPGQVEAWPR